MSVVVVALVLVGCTSATRFQRGAGRDTIHGEAQRILSGHNYSCTQSPSKEFVACTHPEVTDVSVAYLPPSNLLQMWTAFARDDEALADIWRKGQPCSGVHETINKVNLDSVINISCSEETIVMSLVTWVPDAGLSDDDVRGLVGVFSEVVGETIRGNGLLKEAIKEGSASL